MNFELYFIVILFCIIYFIEENEQYSNDINSKSLLTNNKTIDIIYIVNKNNTIYYLE
jgi:hypothetical protein